MEIIREGVHDGRTDAAARRAPDYNHGINARLVQQAHQRRAEKRAWLILLDDDVTRLRHNLSDKFVAVNWAVGWLLKAPAKLALPTSRVICVGRELTPSIKHRNVSRSSRSHETCYMWHGPPTRVPSTIRPPTN